GGLARRVGAGAVADGAGSGVAGVGQGVVAPSDAGAPGPGRVGRADAGAVATGGVQAGPFCDAAVKVRAVADLAVRQAGHAEGDLLGRGAVRVGIGPAGRVARGAAGVTGDAAALGAEAADLGDSAGVILAVTFGAGGRIVQV